MGGNILSGNFLGGDFPGGNFPGGSLMGENFPGGGFSQNRVRQNTAVKTAINACSLLAKQTLSGLVGKRTSSLIINFKQVFIFLVVDCTFYKSNIKSNCILLCHIRVRSRRQNVFCKKGVLRNFAKLTGKRLCQSLFF